MESCRVCTEPCKVCGLDPHDPRCGICGGVHSPNELQSHWGVAYTACSGCGRTVKVPFDRSGSGVGQAPVSKRPPFPEDHGTTGDTHECPAMREAHAYRHEPAFRCGYDEALRTIEWTERGWYAFSANGGEYGTRIWFCPFCGLRLP
jgi:hypothetical protein